MYLFVYIAGVITRDNVWISKYWWVKDHDFMKAWMYSTGLPPREVKPLQRENRLTPFCKRARQQHRDKMTTKRLKATSISVKTTK